MYFAYSYSVLSMNGPTVLDDAEAERGDADKLLASVGRGIPIQLYSVLRTPYNEVQSHMHMPAFCDPILIATSTEYMRA